VLSHLFKGHHKNSNFFVSARTSVPPWGVSTARTTAWTSVPPWGVCRR